MDLVSILSIVVGLLVLSWVLYDVFMTVLILGGGAGPQSSFVADRLWRLSLRMHRPASQRSHSLLRAVGPLIVLLALAIWVVELCLGWALIFVPTAFKSPDDAHFMDRMVFAGKSVVGRSGNAPALEVSSGNWEVVQSIAGTSGVILVSVGLAYVLPILASVAHKRSIAATINTLGASPEDMHRLLRRSEDGQFGLHLLALVATISLAAERHRSYPVLHYFHSKDAHSSLAPAIAKLSILLKLDGDGDVKVDPAVRQPLNRAILNLLEALCRMGLGRYADEVSEGGDRPRIVIDPLENPSGDAAPTFGWLRSYVGFDGWDWDDFFPQT